MFVHEKIIPTAVIRLTLMPMNVSRNLPLFWKGTLDTLCDITNGRRQERTYFLRTISEAPLLYMRKLPSDNLMTVLMDFLTELKV